MNRRKFLLGGAAVAATTPLTSVFEVSGNNIARAHHRRVPQAEIVTEAETGNVLLAYAPDRQVYPASLTKVMTLMIVYDDLQMNRWSLDDQLFVSYKAATTPPSELGLKTGDSIMLGDAVPALSVKSANDVAVAIAENLEGSVDAFAVRMNAKAAELGMTSTHFTNPHGLPDAGQVTTARDMATMARALINHYPDLYPVFSQRTFSFGGRIYENHNRLLGRVDGVDGIKTGYIDDSGANLMASQERGGKRVIAVAFGGHNYALQARNVARLMDRGLDMHSGRPYPEPPPQHPRRREASQLAVRPE